MNQKRNLCNIRNPFCGVLSVFFCLSLQQKYIDQILQKNPKRITRFPCIAATNQISKWTKRVALTGYKSICPIERFHILAFRISNSGVTSSYPKRKFKTWYWYHWMVTVNGFFIQFRFVRIHSLHVQSHVPGKYIYMKRIVESSDKYFKNQFLV